MKKIRIYLKKLYAFLHKMPGWIWLIPILILAVNVRLTYLTKADIWHDEGYTAAIIQQPIGEIIAITTTDVHPPLYYVIMHVWQLIFGNSVASLRGFSVTCGVLTIALLFLLLQKLFSKRIAVFGSFLAALGPFLIRYSDEARMYALAALLAVAMTYAFVVAVEHKNKKFWWALYGILVALGLYTQYFLALILPAHFVYIWLKLGGNHTAIKNIFKDKNVWLAAGACFLLFLPWLPVMISQTSRVSDGFWIPEVTKFTIPTTLSMFLTYDDRIVRYFGLLLPPIIVVISFILAKKHSKYQAAIWILTIWLLLPMIIVYTLSQGRPVYLDRYFTYSAPVFYGLIAVFIGLIFSNKKWWSIGISIILTLFIGHYMWHIGSKNIAESSWNNTNTAMNHINKNIQSSDVIISGEIYTYFHTSYYNRTNKEIILLKPKEELGWVGEWGLIKKLNTPEISSLESVKSPRIWLILREKTYDEYKKQVPPYWQLKQEFHYGDLIIGLYENKK